MKKIRHIARDIDPETGDVQHFRAGYTNRELKDQGRMTRYSPTKAQKSRRKKKRKKHYAGCPARPLFTSTTPRLEADDPERLEMRAQVLAAAGHKCAYCGARWPSPWTTSFHSARAAATTWPTYSACAHRATRPRQIRCPTR